jgi:Thiamine pyrophosphate enzyme, central domain
MDASRPANAMALRALLRAHKLPTVCTYQGAGVVPRELLDCFAGRIGLFHNQPSDRLLDAADLVVTVGYNPIEYDPGSLEPGQAPADRSHRPCAGRVRPGLPADGQTLWRQSRRRSGCCRNACRHGSGRALIPSWTWRSRS